MPATPILIAGAGPVGLTAALALHHAGHAVRVIDARPVQSTIDDPRAVALAHGSRLILERFGVWQHITTTPIAHIHVSQQGGFGQTRIEADDYRLPALGYVTRLGGLTGTLLHAVQQAGIAVDAGHTLTSTAHTANSVLATIEHGGVTHQSETGLLIAAEGKPPATAQRKDYGQTAIVTEVWSAAPADSHSRMRTGTHAARSTASSASTQAWERFTPEGPLALLPLDGGHSVVWCMRAEHAQQAMAQDDTVFLAHLNQALAYTRQRFTRIAARAAFPLALVQADGAHHLREIALGNAAQTLHPVAGQGLNLGLRDAFELAGSLKPGLTIDALSRYTAQRTRDRRATITLTDQYVSLFSNQFAPLRIARGTGLALFNLLPPLRHAMARRMMFGVR